MKFRVIVNPKAGAGSAGRKVPAVSRSLQAAGVPYDIAETRAPGDATLLAARARADGVDAIIAVGGDGTLNEIGQAYVDAGGRAVAGPALGLVPAGTGGDFRRVFGLDGDVGASVRRILGAAPRPVDVGVVDLTGDAGEPVRRAFVNIASFGVSGRIDRLVNRSPKWMGGRVAFAVGTVRALTTYKNAPVSIRVDGKPWYEGKVVVVAIANGRYFGGGMEIAPRAGVADGLLDVVVSGDLTFAETLRNGPDLYSGRLLGKPKVHFTRGKDVEAVPLGSGPVYIDTDGETPGQLPLRARILPGALTLLV